MRRILSLALACVLCFSLTACGVTSNSNVERVIKNRHGYNTKVVSSEEYTDYTTNQSGILYHLEYTKDGVSYPFDFFMQRTVTPPELTKEQEAVLSDPNVTQEDIDNLDIDMGDAKEQYSYNYDTFTDALFSAWMDQYTKSNPLTQFAKGEDGLWSLQIQSLNDIDVARDEYVRVAQALSQDEEMAKLVFGDFKIESADPMAKYYAEIRAPWGVQYDELSLTDQFNNSALPMYVYSMYNLGADLTTMPEDARELLNTVDKDEYVITLDDKSYAYSLVMGSALPLARIPSLFDALDIQYSGDYSKFEFTSNDQTIYAGLDVVLEDNYWCMMSDDSTLENVQDLTENSEESSEASTHMISNSWIGTTPQVSALDLIQYFIPDAELTCNGVLVEISPAVD